MLKRLFFVIFTILSAAGALFAADAAKPGAEPGEKTTLQIAGVDYTFVWCPAGEFTMGSPASEEGRYDAEVPHKVTLTRGFWLLESEVTQKMWESAMGTNVRQECEKAGGRWVTAAGPDFPMYYVDWDGAKAFCAKLSELSGLGITLPTEAQWEYACRAGSDAPFGGSGDPGEMAWYAENSEFKAHEVKTKSPNAWGLYDMHGNVYEWCLDQYGELGSAAATDPLAADKSVTHVYRGGCWDSLARHCRSAFRMKYPLTRRLDYAGLRILLVPGTED
ncbi:MAG: formylglycine-generating enzyme family protein [Thermoguttaceae bacterium]|nr:formylglycine-generating enzyme family protein [Thermoguttaceae bacterium]